jgi:4-amino-4-deoxy-L-arabinose transferase-like glycosyltransferase
MTSASASSSSQQNPALKSLDSSVAEDASETSRQQADRRTWAVWITVILLTAAVTFGSISATRPKFNRSEIAYALISREMMEKNSFIMPLYRGVPCIDKPIMNYWAIIAGFKTLGPCGLAARLGSLAAAVSCLFLFAVSIRKLWGSQASLLGTMILATSERFWEFATLCMTDMLLCLFDNMSLVFLFASIKNEKNRLLWYCLAGASMALGTLTKGPVALILPGFSYCLYLLLTRRLKTLSIKHIAIAAAVFFAVAAPWHIAAASAVSTPDGVLTWFWHYNVERFFGSTFSFTHPPSYMVQSLFLGFAPWSIFLPFAAVSALIRWRKKTNPEQSQDELYLWIWVILTTTFFTLSRGKMNYYDLPAFPAVSGIVALHISNWIKDKQKGRAAGAWLLTAVLYAGTAISAYILPQVTTTSDISVWFLMPLGFLLGALYSTWALVKDKPMQSYGAVYASLCCALFAFAWQIHPAFLRQAPANGYILTLKKHPEARIALHSDFAKTIDWEDVTLFETRRLPDRLNDSADLAAYLEKPGPALVIVPEDRYLTLPQGLRDKLTVVENRPYMYQKIDLAFFLKGHGKLTGPIPLLLVANEKI